MTSLFRNLFHLNSTIKRCLHSSAIRRCVFDQGKTTVQFMNKEVSNGFLINGFSEVGFNLSMNFNVVGPLILFPRIFFSWNIASSSDMNGDNLCLFDVIEPKLDVLVIGLDMQYPTNAPFLVDVRAWLKEKYINAEILPVQHAASTYNFLASEGRFVAAALVPPKQNITARSMFKPLPDHERLPAY